MSLTEIVTKCFFLRLGNMVHSNMQSIKALTAILYIM